MSGPLARAGAFFLAPPRPATITGVAAPAAGLVAVLATPRDLPAVAGGVAADLRRQHGARTALVCGEAPPRPFPGTPAARRLARRLAGRDLVAVACGALCHVAVADARDAWRAITGAADVPVVVALPSRDAGWDALLADADRRLLAVPAGSDEALAELALASLAALGPAARVSAPLGPLARRRAALGLRRVAPVLVEAPA